MIELVPSKEEYAELWLKWRSELSTINYNPLAKTTIESVKKRISLVSADLSDLKSAKEFRFFVKKDNDIVGTIALKCINHMMMYGEIGYGIGEKFQGQGVATDTLGYFVKKIFNETSLRRLIAYVAEDNIASCRVLEKAGFVKEGVCREHYLINGKPTNEIIYGLLRSDKIAI